MATQKSRWHPCNESDAFIFAVCERFLQVQSKSGPEGDKTGGVTEVARWVREEFKRDDVSREKIYPIVWEAILHRGFLRLIPPLERELAGQLMTAFQLLPRGSRTDPPPMYAQTQKEWREITVVNAFGQSAASHVASVAADKIIELILEVAEAKGLKPDSEDENKAVHLGMGAGFVSMLVAKGLAVRVARGEWCPPLVIHAISSGGFFVNEPQKSPMTYFSYFDNYRHNVRYVALFAETMVEAKEYEQVMKRPALADCFAQKNDIDIIVTSLAKAQHEHGLLRQYLTYICDRDPNWLNSVRQMDQQGWVGDVQFCPYSAAGPINADNSLRAVTLFGLEELVEFVKQKDKYIVLVGGPCGECNDLKTEALLPLMRNRNLRLWSHLVTDVKTANALLQAQKEKTPYVSRPY